MKEKDLRKHKFDFPLIIVICDNKKLKLEMTKTAIMLMFRSGDVFTETDLIEEVAMAEFMNLPSSNAKY